MHIIDIVQNSISAGATEVSVEIDVDKEADLMTIAIEDNGKGMTPEQVESLCDPFFTSRTTRRVGLGVPLFGQSAKQSGGELTVESELGKGTTVRATFQESHIDRPPMGDLAGSLMINVVAHNEVEFTMRYRYNGEEYIFSTREVKENLGDDFLRLPEAFGLLKELVANNLANLTDDL